jgi:UDP-GlcNAc:undecaprenyl-phosphate GlcNAc-1-phosphate transferase
LISLFYFRILAFKLDLLDHPIGRKIHTIPVPLVGGLSIYLGLLTGLLLLEQDQAFIFSSLLLVFIGVFDDYMDVSHRMRILFQLFASIVLLEFSNISVTSLGNIFNMGDLLLYQASYFFTIIAIVGAINAMNFMDGLDGLATTLALVTFISVIILTYLSNAISIISLLFCVVLTPFLYANLLSKNKIFLGDAGSTLLGFGIAWVLMNSSQGSEAILKPVTALWIFSIPLFDTVSVIARRVLNSKSPFHPDMTHIHHILLKKFRFSKIQTLFVVLTLAIIMALFGITMELISVSERTMFYLFLSIFLLYFLVTSYWSNQEY